MWSDLLLTVSRALNTNKRTLIRIRLRLSVKKKGGVIKEDLNKHKKEIIESVKLNCYPGARILSGTLKL
jgi:hypothetical protein